MSALLLALGLFLLPKVDPARRRLAWLATSRLGRARSMRPIAGRARWLPSLSWPAQAGLIALVAGLAAGCWLGPIPGCLAGAGGWTLSWCRRPMRRERAADRDRGALAIAVGALADEYAAGATLAAALSACAPAGGRFGPALAEAGTLASYGAAPDRALAAEPALARLGVACALVNRTGASFTGLLAGIRADLAADRATRRAVAAAVAGPRASAMLLSVLPIVGLAMGTAMGAQPGRTLLHTPIGLAALSAGVLLDLAGLVWTLRLTRPIG